MKPVLLCFRARGRNLGAAVDEAVNNAWADCPLAVLSCGKGQPWHARGAAHSRQQRPNESPSRLAGAKHVPVHRGVGQEDPERPTVRGEDGEPDEGTGIQI